MRCSRCNATMKWIISVDGNGASAYYKCRRCDTETRKIPLFFDINNNTTKREKER